MRLADKRPIGLRVHAPAWSASGSPQLCRLALVWTSVLLVGCASPGPQHTRAAASTAASLGLADGASMPVAARWWSSLGDARLDQLVEQALRGSPDLALARARLQRAAALEQFSRSAAGPQITLGADLTIQRYTENGLVAPPVAGDLRNSATLQASLGWSPDILGGQAAAQAAALGLARAAQADAASAATALAAQVSRSYVALARLLAQRAVISRVLANRQEVLGLTRERVSAGLDGKLELTRAEGALPEARTQIEALQEQVALARRQIAVLTAQAPDALDDLSPLLADLNLEQVPAALGADLLGRRADVVAARWRVESALQDVKLARIQFSPNLNLNAFLGLNALGLGNLLEFGSRQYGVAPALRLPLFDSGRLQAQLGGRQAELDGAIAQYNAALLGAVKEAGDAIGSGQSLGRQQREQADALESAQTALAVSEQRYQAGLGSYLIVLGAELELLSQRRLALDLRARAGHPGGPAHGAGRWLDRRHRQCRSGCAIGVFGMTRASQPHSCRIRKMLP